MLGLALISIAVVLLVWWNVAAMRRHRLGLHESRRRLADDLAAMTRLQALSTQLVQAGELRTLLPQILAAAADLTGTDKGNIQLYDAATGRLRIVAHQGLGRRLVEHFAEQGWAATCDAAAEKKERLILEDVAAASAFQGTIELEIVLEDGIRAIQSTPLITRTGRLLGMLNNHYRVLGRPSDRQLGYIDVLARMAADVVERTQVESALRDADRHKDQFLATLAHELRGPLAPLRNSLEILKHSGTLPPVGAVMERQLNQLTCLVDDLIDVSRVTHNKIELRKERLELAAVIQQGLEACHPYAAQSKLQVYVDLPAEPIQLYADPVRMAQVFGNVINNACKFTDEGGAVRIKAERNDATAVVTIADTGIGIPGDQLDRVFETFTQLDLPPGRRHSGLGIGLALVKRLVELHGGTVTVRSEGLGRGSAFTIRLPALVGAPPVVQASAVSATL